MSIDPSLNTYWQYYVDRAAEAEAARADDFGAGREEQLGELLRAAVSNRVLSVTERERLDRLPRNRAKKHTRLRRHLASEAFKVVNNTPVQVYRAVLDDEIAWIRSKLTLAEWDVEWRLACGQTFDELAVVLRIKPEALRARASRWRAKIRCEVR